MKKNVHPEYKETTIVCACGEVIKTKSTKENIRIDICSKCHPFFTGKQKLLDAAGRVEKFAKRYAGKVKPKGEQKAE
jgi:large subunit ribosomal protein L31